MGNFLFFGNGACVGMLSTLATELDSSLHQNRAGDPSDCPDDRHLGVDRYRHDLALTNFFYRQIECADDLAMLLNNYHFR